MENTTAYARSVEAARGLLDQAKTFYRLLEANRREPFNVFTAIRRSHDEVNLHSRFLQALLSCRDAEGRRPYLRKFLSSIENVSDFEPGADSAVVMREHRNIDLLITHRNPDWAVIIENKIDAGDQHQQLVRYRATVLNEGFSVPSIAVLYLTPDGRKPSPQSIEYRNANGEKTGEVPYECVSYADDLLPWLVSCQQHACDDPHLRESTAQYRSVVEQLTGHSLGGPYMKELMALCVKRLPVVMDLADMLEEAQRHVLKTIWTQIDQTVHARLGQPGASFWSKGADFGTTRIDNMLSSRGSFMGWHGLLWPLRPVPKLNPSGVLPPDQRNMVHPAPALGVEIAGGRAHLMYGIRCAPKHSHHDTIEEVLTEYRGGRHQANEWWPWSSGFRGVLGSAKKREVWENLAMVANDPEMLTACASEIAETFVEIMDTLRKEQPSLFEAL